MRPLLLGLLGGLLALPLSAQRTPVDSLRDDAAFSFYAKGPYRTSVPKPDELLGYGIGTWHTQYAAQERVLLAIAESAKDRVHVEEIGQTSEKRTMRLYVVSSPENIARLDRIRADLDRIADPRSANPSELDAIAARVPAVVWFSGSVHGDEVPGFEASMALLYHFAATEDPRTVALLKDAIVIINPSSNPDGHERFSVWSNSIAVGSPERVGLEQQRGQPWTISGRYNHYRFDMNRDLIATTQREVRNIVGGMLRWHPMVTADLHGYTVQYYMAPAARPINANISNWPNKWGEAIGAGNARAFDAFGWMYYVRDQFDLYYPGYYDTWPSLTGATGATYETDGGPALLKRRDDGTLLSLRDGIAKHYTAAIATFETTAGRARERVKDYLAFRQGAIADGKSQPMKRVVLTLGSDPARAGELAAALLRAGVDVYQLSQPLTSSKAHAYADDAIGARTFPAGSLVVDLAQPHGRLAKAVLEPDPSLDPVFAKAQLDYFTRNINRGKNGDAEGYEFYDITAWALPVAFGVDAWWTEDAAPITGERLALPPQPAPRVNGEALPFAVRSGIVEGRDAKSAFVWRNDRAGASRLAGQLLQEGYRLAIASQPIQTGAINWPRGTWVARVSRNDATLAARLDALAQSAGVEVVGVQTAFPETAQFGTGSGSTVSVREPKIAIVADQGIGLGAYGALWWSFEQRYGITFTPVSLNALNGDLSMFNVIIIPDGGVNSLGKAPALKAWVERGGTLITMGRATSWAAREETALTSARILSADEKDTSKSDEKKSDSTAAKKDGTTKGSISSAASVAGADSLLAVKSPSANANTPQPIPGAHFDVVLDRTHWLTLGIEKPRMTVLMDGDEFLKLSKDGSNVAVFPTSGPLRRAGFTFPDNTERLLKGTALVVEERVGRGHVVLFANDPLFRGFWRSLDRVVLNAVLLGGGF